MALHDEREVLRQAGTALQRPVVTLWEIAPGGGAIPVVSSIAEPPSANMMLDLNATLRQWGAPIIEGSRWVGCLTDVSRWCIAPVRTRAAAPPPDGIERRSRDRLVLELTGLAIGSLDRGSRVPKRLPPADALWEFARQPSVIAHEVGNPLTVALGNLDLSVDALKGDTSLSATAREMIIEDLAKVAHGIERAADYLRSIQDRPFAGVARLARFDAIPILRSCVVLEKPLARTQRVALQLESSVESIYLFGDSASLYQVLTNLIRNAVDASRGHAPVVTIHVSQHGETLHIAVRDCGAGIPSAMTAKIFDPGFTTKPLGKGSGIGLTVVKEITQKMFGGRIEVTSQSGKGSTFTLVLPIPPQRSGSHTAP